MGLLDRLGTSPLMSHKTCKLAHLFHTVSGTHDSSLSQCSLQTLMVQLLQQFFLPTISRWAKICFHFAPHFFHFHLLVHSPIPDLSILQSSLISLSHHHQQTKPQHTHNKLPHVFTTNYPHPSSP